MSGSWKDIEQHWIKLRDQSSFDLNIPCVAINKDGDLYETTLWGLTNHIDIPLMLSKQLLFNYLELVITRGEEAAQTEMKQLSAIEVQTFFDELQKFNNRSHSEKFCTVNDVIKAIDIAQDGYNKNPRKMLIVQLGELRADLLLASPPSNDGRN